MVWQQNFQLCFTSWTTLVYMFYICAFMTFVGHLLIFTAYLCIVTFRCGERVFFLSHPVLPSDIPITYDAVPDFLTSC